MHCCCCFTQCMLWYVGQCLLSLLVSPRFQPPAAAALPHAAACQCSAPSAQRACCAGSPAWHEQQQHPANTFTRKLEQTQVKSELRATNKHSSLGWYAFAGDVELHCGCEHVTAHNENLSKQIMREKQQHWMFVPAVLPPQPPASSAHLRGRLWHTPAAAAPFEAWPAGRQQGTLQLLERVTLQASSSASIARDIQTAAETCEPLPLQD